MTRSRSPTSSSVGPLGGLCDPRILFAFQRPKGLLSFSDYYDPQDILPDRRLPPSFMTPAPVPRMFATARRGHVFLPDKPL